MEEQIPGPNGFGKVRICNEGNRVFCPFQACLDGNVRAVFEAEVGKLLWMGGVRFLDTDAAGHFLDSHFQSFEVIRVEGKPWIVWYLVREM